jgi:hypothetical protein
LGFHPFVVEDSLNRPLAVSLLWIGGGRCGQRQRAISR